MLSAASGFSIADWWKSTTVEEESFLYLLFLRGYYQEIQTNLVLIPSTSPPQKKTFAISCPQPAASVQGVKDSRHSPLRRRDRVVRASVNIGTGRCRALAF